ncbi:MAG: Uma2 family endonuclease [Pirellulales bacterium]
MATIDSLREYRHGVWTYRPEAFDHDRPWDAPGRYTLADWEKLPEGMHCELIEGHIVMSPTPRFNHQFFVGLLYELMTPQARRRGDLTILSPYDVILAKDVILEPDLIYLTKERIPQIHGWLHGAPDIVVEVVSPTSCNRDRKKKFDLYQEHRVPEYWLFDPMTESAEFYVLEHDRYRAVEPQTTTYRSPCDHGLTLDLDELWTRYRNRPAQ